MSRHAKKEEDSAANGHVGVLAHEESETNGAHPSIDEQIRLRAYELYMERGAQPNDDLADWLRAERDIRLRAAAELQGPPS
jgi:hypothetical protein